MTASTSRTRADMCPGVLRPWRADDGLLVRLRLVGGRLPVPALTRLLQVSARYADGNVYLTKRANLQLRGLPERDGAVPSEAVAALESTGLLPSRTHELVRNILVSPQTGVVGGRADLRPVADELDALLRSDPELGRLPGRFLFTLDDGHGDLLDRLTGPDRHGTDLGLIALDGTTAQVRVGERWGTTVSLARAAGHLTDLANTFLAARGTGAGAAWHVRELTEPLRPPAAPDPRLPRRGAPLPYGDVPGGRHVRIPDGVLTPEQARALLGDASDRMNLVVTPWHGILDPSETRDAPISTEEGPR